MGDKWNIGNKDWEILCILFLGLGIWYLRMVFFLLCLNVN